MNDKHFGYDNEFKQYMQNPHSSITQKDQYRFSSEELRVLAECNKEGFFKRSLPLGTILGLGTYMAVKSGYLNPNPRFGAAPKMTLAVVMGYFIGKLSYQQACAEKLMALPGSYIGQVLRDRRDGKINTLPPPPKQTTTMFGATANDIYSDAGPGSSLDIDTDRPLFDDDTHKPDNEGSILKPPEITPQHPSMTYEELRRKNRSEFADLRQDPYKLDPNSVPVVTRPVQPPGNPASGPMPSAPAANKYGDIME